MRTRASTRTRKADTSNPRKKQKTTKILDKMDTRFKELPSEVISIVIDFISISDSRTVVNFVLTGRLVSSAFRENPRFKYHQFKACIPSMLQYMLSIEGEGESAEKELDQLIAVIKKPHSKVQAMILLEQRRPIWKNWVQGKTPVYGIEYPTNLNLTKKQRQEVYDKFYSRVTFESVKVERGFVNRDTGDISTKRMSSIRIGADILLTYENLKDNQDESDYVDINIVYEQADDTTPRRIFICEAVGPFAGNVALDEFRAALGLNSVTDHYHLLDLIVFAFLLTTVDE